MTTTPSPQGAGLGLRREFLDELIARHGAGVDFLEVAPENWIGVGGVLGRKLRALTERHPFVLHGLSLSIGGPGPLDEDLVRDVRRFMDVHGIDIYSEHLSYCSDDGQLYDLLSIPFTEDAVRHVAARIRRVQDLLGQRLVIENVSYYAAPGAEMSELEFINAVLAEADCGLLLDVNNIYVNSVNHRYDAEAFLRGLPPERVVYGHVAGHYDEAEDLLVDTHGADVIDPVWRLLAVAYEHCGVFPTLVERDFNIPPLDHLLQEVATVRRLQAAASGQPQRSRAHG